MPTPTEDIETFRAVEAFTARVETLSPDQALDALSFVAAMVISLNFPAADHVKEMDQFRTALGERVAHCLSAQTRTQ